VSLKTFETLKMDFALENIEKTLKMDRVLENIEKTLKMKK
jgi:hypothetical protein